MDARNHTKSPLILNFPARGETGPPGLVSEYKSGRHNRHLVVGPHRISIIISPGPLANSTRIITFTVWRVPFSSKNDSRVWVDPKNILMTDFWNSDIFLLRHLNVIKSLNFVSMFQKCVFRFISIALYKSIGCVWRHFSEATSTRTREGYANAFQIFSRVCRN